MHQGNGSAQNPEAISHAELVEAIAEEVWNQLCRSLGVPPEKPDWVSRVVRIPERRIRQILGE